MEYFNEYRTAILTIGSVGLLMFIQIVIADMVGIVKKHIPGYPIEHNHKQFLFRATRVYLNTNESVSIFILFVCFAILSSADPDTVNISALGYLGSRVAHMCCYYFNVQIARSAAFVVSLVSLMALFITGINSWL